MEPTYDQPVTVGSKDFTEQYILGSMTVQLLEANGYEVEDQSGLGGTTVNREALEAGEIDVYWEYTGTALVNFLGIEEVVTDPDEAYSMSAEADEANGLTWLDPADFNNTYTLMVTQDTVDAGVTSISDLAAEMQGDPDSYRLCTNAEFYARPDGFRGVEELYGFAFPEDGVIAMDSGLTYQALLDGECEVAMGFATDGRIAAFNFTNLDDDEGFFPTYNPAPVIRQEVLDADMGIGIVLNRLGSTLDTATMTELNKRVDVDGEDVETVACDHLLSNGLVDSCE
jgi:osmoprotectant transport system substrate-binding protein